MPNYIQTSPILTAKYDKVSDLASLINEEILYDLSNVNEIDYSKPYIVTKSMYSLYKILKTKNKDVVWQACESLSKRGLFIDYTNWNEQYKKYNSNKVSELKSFKGRTSLVMFLEVTEHINEAKEPLQIDFELNPRFIKIFRDYSFRYQSICMIRMRKLNQKARTLYKLLLDLSEKGSWVNSNKNHRQVKIDIKTLKNLLNLEDKKAYNQHAQFIRSLKKWVEELNASALIGDYKVVSIEHDGRPGLSSKNIFFEIKLPSSEELEQRVTTKQYNKDQIEASIVAKAFKKAKKANQEVLTVTKSKSKQILHAIAENTPLPEF